MAKGEVRIPITADASGVRRGTREAEKELKRLNTVGKRSLSTFGKGALAAGGITVGLHSVTSFLSSSATAAMDAEASLARMRTQLQNLGKDSPTVRKNIDGVVQGLAQISGFDDEDLQDAFTRIVGSTGNVTKALGPQGLALASDIARARQIPLATAASAVSKAWDGQTGALKKLGVEVKQGDTNLQVLAAAQKQFAGQAQAFGKTTAGSVARMSVQWENLKEVIGAKLAPAIQYVADNAPKWGAKIQKSIGPKLAELRGAAQGFYAALRRTGAVDWVAKQWQKYGPIISQAAVNAFTAPIRSATTLLQVAGAAAAAIAAAVKAAKGFVGLGPRTSGAGGGGGGGGATARGAFVFGEYGNDDVPVRVTGGEAILNPNQIDLVGRDRIMSVLGMTGANSIFRGGGFKKGAAPQRLLDSTRSRFDSGLLGLDASLAKAELTDVFSDDEPILRRKQTRIRSRIRSVNKYLNKYALKRAQRDELNSELTSLYREDKAISDLIRDAKSITTDAGSAGDDPFAVERARVSGVAEGLGRAAAYVFGGSGDIGSGGSSALGAAGSIPTLHVERLSFTNSVQNQAQVARAGNGGNDVISGGRIRSSRIGLAF